MLDVHLAPCLIKMAITLQHKIMHHESVRDDAINWHDSAGSLETSTDNAGEQPAPVQPSDSNVHLVQERSSLPQVELQSMALASADTTAQPMFPASSSPEQSAPSAARTCGNAKDLPGGSVGRPKLGGIGQVAGVAAMGLAAGLVASGVSVEIVDAAILSAVIATGSSYPLTLLLHALF